MTTTQNGTEEALPGDQLRDLAARLLSFQYGEPHVEQRVDGKKVDVYFEFSELGKTRRLFVEAKDYNRNLTRSEVVNIYSDYLGLLESNRPSQLLIVTSHGLSTDAGKYVSEERFDVTHQTIWQLEKTVLGLDEYVRHLSKSFDEDGLSLYYVESRARHVNYAGDNLSDRSIETVKIAIFDYITDWISSPDRRPIAILGGYGAGKSSLARRVTSALAHEALRDPTARIPILIRLGQFSRAASVEGLITGMFAQEFPVRNFNISMFLDSAKRGRFVLICDGFDEMKHAMSWSDFRATIAELNKLNEGDSKLLLLGRPNAFLSRDEHFQVLRGRRRFGDDYRKLANWPEFDEWELSEFDQADRSNFISNYLRYLADSERSGGLSESAIKVRVQKVDSLASTEPEIFSKPVHAQILTELASQPSFNLDHFKQGISRWDLYEAFFDYLAERESMKEARRPVSDDRRLAFLQELAFWLWSQKNGSTSFASVDIPDSVYAVMELEDYDDPEIRAREYLTGAFLEKKLGDVFYFGHRSFAEFLVASRLLSIPPRSKDHEVYASLLEGSVLDFFEEGLRGQNLKEWAKSYTGDVSINFSYCRFIAKHCGNFREFKRLLPSSGTLSKVLNCFDDRLSFGPVLEKRLIKLADSNSEHLFYVSLAIADLSLAKRHLRKEGVDKISLLDIARLVIENPIFSRKCFKSMKNSEIYEINGTGLRRIIEDYFVENDLSLVDEQGAIRSDGWPDSWQVTKNELLFEGSFIYSKIHNLFKRRPSALN